VSDTKTDTKTDTKPAPATEPDGAEAEAALVVPMTRHGALVSDSRGQTVVHPTCATYVKVVTALKAEGFVTCADLCAVDYLTAVAQRLLPDGMVAERFEIAVNLTNFATRERIRVRVQVAGDDPTIPSLYDVYPGTEAMEREAFDLFGVIFEGHPDLTRILLPETWVGHPLRKDEATGRIPVQFSENSKRSAAEVAVAQSTAAQSTAAQSTAAQSTGQGGTK
jgi:NADH-quinone oxidoreductase subunit C